MLMVQKGFLIGEFDINFDGEGKAAEQYVITEKNKKNLGHGKMEITKHEDSGESQVHFTEWTGSEMPELQDAWGVYMLKDGSSQVMTVLEFAVSKNQIEHLDDGLKQGNAYFVGVSCKDKDHCDFTKATPPMALTYASEYYEFLDQQFIQ